MSTEFSIRRLPIEELDELEPMWSALREHHGAVAPENGPTRERAESWAIRRGIYEEWLRADDGSFALIARDASGQAVGYAMVAMPHGAVATWPHSHTGCLETLSILPSARGAGLGTALMAEARAGLAAQGVTNMTIDVIAGNDDALRFYARHGFEPYVIALRGSTTGD